MKKMARTALALVLTGLLALTGLAAASAESDISLEYMSHRPSEYIGEWKSLEGGGDAYRDYYLYVNDFVDGQEFRMNFDLYRLYGFDNAMAVIEGYDYATFVAEDEQYLVIGKLDFLEDELVLTILISDYPYLEEDQTIVFERA